MFQLIGEMSGQRRSRRQSLLDRATQTRRSLAAARRQSAVCFAQQSADLSQRLSLRIELLSLRLALFLRSLRSLCGGELCGLLLLLSLLLSSGRFIRGSQLTCSFGRNFPKMLRDDLARAIDRLLRRLRNV